jgi:uncharacterized protein
VAIQGKKNMAGMLIPTIILGVIAVVMVVMGWRMEGGQHVAGLTAAWRMTLQVAPLLIFAFIIAGMVQVLLPQEMVAKWVGGESGWRGIMIGTVAGGLSPGGPYVSLPIAAGLMQSGAGIGTMVAYLTAWSLWAVARLPMEVGIMGWEFTLIRVATTFFFPPIAGGLAQWIFGR